MKRENFADLLPFYFGTIDSDARLETERKLLEQPDVLIDYFDLKRELEAAEILPSEPSPRVWARLSDKMRRSPRKSIFALSLGVAVAAGLAACVLFFSKPSSLSTHDLTHDVGGKGILFDSGELSRSGGVL